MRSRLTILGPGRVGKSTHQPRWIAGIDARFSDIASNDSPCTDHGTLADRDRQNGCVRADRDPITHPRGLPEGSVSACRPTVTERIVDEHDAMTDEAMCADLDELADETVRLHLRPRTYHDAALNLDERPNEDVVAENAFIEVGRLDDTNADTACQ